MEASKDSLVVSNNESVTNVSERDGLTRGYCSPRRYFGDVLAEIEKRGCATHINETIFFDGCRKLGFIFKAKVYGSNIKGNFLYELDNSGSYLPPENITKKMVDDDHSELSFYIRNRGNWGINLGSKDLLPLLTEPLVELLCEFNSSMSDIVEKAEKLKKQMKESGATRDVLRLIDTTKSRQTLINKMFK